MESTFSASWKFVDSNSSQTRQSAATLIQSAYRAHLTRIMVGIIAQVNRETDRTEQQLRTQETVDKVRNGDGKEKSRLNEELMRLLFRLDAVPGIVPTVRELRRRVSRRVVGLQEILDFVASSSSDGELGERIWLPPGSWEEIVNGSWKEEAAEQERCFGEEEEDEGFEDILKLHRLLII